MDLVSVFSLMACSQVFLLLLFFLSEYLSMSSCSANGVIQLICGGCCISGDTNTDTELYYH